MFRYFFLSWSIKLAIKSLYRFLIPSHSTAQLCRTRKNGIKPYLFSFFVVIFSAFVRKKAFVCLMRFHELSKKEASSSVHLFERALADSSFSVVMVAVAFYAKIAQV